MIYVLQVKAGLGDEIGAEPLAREMAASGLEIYVDARTQQWWRNHPTVKWVTELPHGRRVDRLMHLNPLTPAYEKIGNLTVNYAMQAGWPSVSDPTPRMHLTSEEVMQGLELLGEPPEGAPVVVVNPWAGWPSRRWDQGRLAEVVRRLRAQGVYTVELGSKSHDCSGGSYHKGLLDVDLQLFGKTDLRQAAAVLYCSDLFVGYDCGLMHLAASVGLPQVPILGVKPWYSRCYWNSTPVYPHSLCGTGCDGICQRGRHCLSDISVDYVMDRIGLCWKRFPRRLRDGSWGVREKE